jgi:hypothetical protein
MTPQAETTISAADKASVETLESAAVVVCYCSAGASAGI